MRALLLLFVATTACAPTWGIHMRERRDSNLLAEAATDYWTMVRWNDPVRAGVYLATPDQKLRLAKLLGEPTLKLTDAVVMQVVVGDELPDERLPDRREGVASVRVEGYEIRDGRVAVETVEQHWIKGEHGWHIDAKASPLSVDRPW